MRRPSAWLVLLLLGALLPAPVFAQLQITARAASLSVGGLFQTQYSVSSADGDRGTANAVDDFFVRRARILFDLKVGTALDGRIEPDFGGGGVGAGLADLYARMTFGRGFRLSAGQFKRAFSQFELASDTDLPTIERDARIEGVSGCPGVGGVCSFSRLAGRLQFDERDIGLRAEGDLGTRLQYMATLTNGEGRNAADVNDAKSVSGRLTFILAPTVRLSGFAGSHDYMLTNQPTRRAGAFGGDVEIGTFRKGLHLIAGGMAGDNWMSGTGADFFATQALVSYYAALAPGGRLAGIEPMLRLDRSGTEDAAGTTLKGLILTPGISFYVDGKNWLGLNLDRYDPSTGPGAWSLKAQAYFYY